METVTMTSIAKGLVAAVCGLPLAFAPLAGQAANPTAARTVEVGYRVLLTQDLSPRDARERAMREALAEAVRQVVGTRVMSGQHLAQGETKRDGKSLVEERFYSVVQTGAAGKVIQYEMLDSGLVTTNVPGQGRQTHFQVRMNVTVAPEVGSADPAFTVSVSLNRDVLIDRAGEGTSDELIASIRSSQGAYLTVFDVTDDSVQVLLPNPCESRNRVTATAPLEFPPADLRDIGYHFRAKLPAGRSTAQEMLYVVATRTNIPFTEQRGSDGSCAVAQSTLLELNRWLVRIPLDQRATAQALFEVRGLGARRAP